MTTEQEIAAVEPPKAPKTAKVTGFENKTPSLWTILPAEDEGKIVATSSSTQESFEGTIEEFNARLK
jgi:hypothetical protein